MRSPPNRPLTGSFMLQLITARRLRRMTPRRTPICAHRTARIRRVAAAVLAALLCTTLAQARDPTASIQRNDAAQARTRVAQGEYLPLESILADARERFPGRLLEVELDDDEYEVEILMPDGTKVELEYDARTGRLLEVEYDD